MKLDELKALAQKATPGPWHNSQEAATEEYSSVCSRSKSCGVALCEENDDADYIAALSPEVVLALIACVEAADAMRKRHGTDYREDAYDAARAALEKP